MWFVSAPVKMQVSARIGFAVILYCHHSGVGGEKLPRCLNAFRPINVALLGNGFSNLFFHGSFQSSAWA